MFCHSTGKMILGFLCFLFLVSCLRSGFDSSPCDGGVKVDGVCYVQSCEDRVCPKEFVCREESCVALDCFGVVCGTNEDCVKGECYPKTCTRHNCPGWGEVCIEEQCVPATCVGVECPDRQRCANGYCYPVDCGSQPCPGQEEVCFNGACEQRSCVGANCPQGQRCAQGYCYPIDCETEPCTGILEVCVEGRCVSRGCVGVICPEGEKCREGECKKWECDIPSDCDDSNVCTAEECNDSICSQTNNEGASCEDLLFCNGTDTCDGSGGCSVHSGNPCGALTCDEDNKQCVGTVVGLGLVSISSLGYHTCGLTAEGVAYCWGANNCGQLGSGGAAQSTQSPLPVDTSAIPGNKTFVELTGGSYHTCGLTADGVAYCWGRDAEGQLGNGGGSVDTQSPSPVDTSAIPGNKAFVQLAANFYHTCGLTADGVAYCWGSDSNGQLGNGGTSISTQSPSPVDTSVISGNKAFIQLTAGWVHTCGLTADGVAYCWGRDTEGQLGNGGTPISTQSPSPVDTSTIPGNKAFVQLTGGGAHTCGLTADGVAYCWGFDDGGQLGNGGISQDTQSPSPVDTSTIPGNKAFVQLDGGHFHTCGLTAEGVAYCWGHDAEGELGDGGGWQDTQSPSPVDISTLSGNKVFVLLTGGDSHTCGLTADGVAYCWGFNSSGQLGNGAEPGTQSPSSVDTSTIPAKKAFVRLAIGGYHTCGLTAQGVAYCWGDDNYGQLGNGGTSQNTQSPSPVDISTLSGNKVFVQLTNNVYHTCGLTADGAAYCWGLDDNGQLGNGAETGQNTQSPSRVDTSTLSGNKVFVQLSGGWNHTCGLTVDGVAYCWGLDDCGQLGNGGTSQGTQSPSPVDTSTIPGNKAFVHLVSGYYHTCGLTVEGVAYCWGMDLFGQLGNGGASQYAQSPSPVNTSTLSGNKAFVKLVGGIYHTCGLTVEGVAYCWGADEFGQLGNGGTSLDSQSPSPVDTSTIPGNKLFVQLTGGARAPCGITAEGVATCWGLDAAGQLGDGGAYQDTQSPSPVDTSTIPGNKAFVQLVGGFDHSCGLTAERVAYCWGYDQHGELGNGAEPGENAQSPSPVDTSGI
jgi:alpha-tubulin suppressor-like RCC1 family protein